MTIVGISAFYHDSAAAVIQDGEVMAAAQEERFTRKKHDSSFPLNALKYCLEYTGASLNNIDAVVFYDKPFLKFERLLETYYAFAPKGLLSFIAAVPVWLKEKLFLKNIIIDSLKKVEEIDAKKIKLLFPEHHLSHAASAFYPSPFKKAAIITIDGVGEWATASICLADENNITILKQMDFPHSLGLLYSAFTYYCGFKVNSGEYKLMGLAPYGNPDSDEVKKFINTIKTILVDIKEDGSIFLNQNYFNYATGLKMVDENSWEKLFGFRRRVPESSLEQQYCDLALAIQIVCEEIIYKLAQEAKKLTGADYLCMAGGVALNCVANGKLDESKTFKKIYIQPAAGDAGGAVGAALAAYHIYFEKERKVPNAQDGMKGSYLGPEYHEDDVLKLIKKHKAVYDFYPEVDKLLKKTAELIATGFVVGWHQGRMEFGPRSLGARSILADARNPVMQKKLNLRIKFRESFRPFGPSVLAEDVSEYFEHQDASPYMLLVKPIVKQRRICHAAEFTKNYFLERLYFLRSDIPAVTHVDYSVRFQTVHKETNELYWKLLQTFKKNTGCSVLINTSFNVRGEPIVNTPEDAYGCFIRTDMDYLIIGNFIFDKTKQDTNKRREELKANFGID
jgi:carbamoyltransferase